MSYLRLRRTQLILACFLVASLLLVEIPAIDLRISAVFFDGGFRLSERWAMLFQDSVRYLLGLSLVLIAGLYFFNRFARRDLAGIDGKKVTYLFLVLILGAGLVVNGVLKSDFGRARPRDIEEFGGPKHFTPAFVISQECDRNCSFSSGDGAGAFFSLALAVALSRKRAMLLAALAYGGLVSLSRVASGAHFFSDVVVSFFVMLIAADVLHHYLLLPDRAEFQRPNFRRNRSASASQRLSPGVWPLADGWSAMNKYRPAPPADL